jgi:hypothetical protein
MACSTAAADFLVMFRVLPYPGGRVAEVNRERLSVLRVDAVVVDAADR